MLYEMPVVVFNCEQVDINPSFTNYVLRELNLRTASSSKQSRLLPNITLVICSSYVKLFLIFSLISP